ncbi:MAG TPA: ABC transporter permease [Micromonosporaceae bacterium]
MQTPSNPQVSGRGTVPIAALRTKTRDVLTLLVRRDLVVKYQDSTLGYLWSLLEPLGMAVTYWFVFGIIYKENKDGLPLHIVVGIFAWMWCQAAISESTKALTTQATLITTIKAPRSIFPISRVVARFAEYVAGIPIIVVFAIIFAQYANFNARLLWMILAIATQFVLLTGMALFLSSVNVLYTDIERMMRVVLRVLFYMAPVVYPLTKVTGIHSDSLKTCLKNGATAAPCHYGGLPGWGVRIYEYNPMVGIFQMYHHAWERTAELPYTLVLKAMIGSFIVLGIGWWTFHKLEATVLKEL